jgi:hypothetical protein
VITFEEFESIDKEVQTAVYEAFDYVKNKTINYVLFLANGEYHEKSRYWSIKLSPYMIDAREDRYKDEDRRNFFIEFLRTFYGFPDKRPLEDDLNRIHMELMVYSHIWESKPFLKQLNRLAVLIDHKSYPWEVKIPDMSKHEFIRFEIRDLFKKRGLALSNVITNGFHTSLRNAFAHSEYYFNKSSKKIVLDTYKGASWDLQDISFDDWSKRFAYTFLLCYYVQNVFFERRESLIKDFGTNRFLIIFPKTANIFRAVYLRYHHEFDTFNFESNES